MRPSHIARAFSSQRPPYPPCQKKLPSPALAAEAHHQSIVTVKTM